MSGRTKYLLILLLLVIQNITAQDLTHFRQNKSSFHGSISATGTYYHSNGMTPRRAPLTGIITGNFTVNLKGFVMPFSFSYSDQNKEFRQPFNQFGLSPRYKWITLHLGYRNINFSKYVLGGHTVFGIGVELNPGIFHFGFVYGKLKRTTNAAINIFKPTNDTLMDFNRKMISFKIGVGNQKNFVDLNILRARDDSTSVSQDYENKSVYPAANLAAGLHTRIQLAKNLSFEAEGAFSVYTEDQNSAVKMEDVSETIQKIIPINISTTGKLAVDAKLSYQNSKNFQLGLQYRRIDPGYRSMGAYFMNNDVENITLNTGFEVLKKKMKISGSLGLERNNLKTLRNATTHKTIGSLNINYNPNNKFGITATYSNYSINQRAGRIQIADSVKVYQTNGTLMISPHYCFSSKSNKTQHFISLVFTKMKLTDKNPDSEYNNNFSTINNILSYSLTFIPYGINFMLSLNQNHITMQTGESSNIGGTLGINKRFKKPRSSIGLSATYTNSKNGQQKINTLTPVLNAQLQLGKHHRFRLKANIIKSNNSQTAQSASEQIVMLSYIFGF
jgi:hypothetical protein